MRHLFGVSPIVTDWTCICGKRALAGHFHCCNRVHGPSTNMRHETVVQELSSFADSHLQLHVHKAPSIATADGRLIDGARHIVPDIVFRGAGIKLAIDVSFVFSESDGRLIPFAHQDGMTAYNVVLSAMRKRATAKVKKYRDSCARDGLQFEAFVIDSHGAFDECPSGYVSWF